MFSFASDTVLDPFLGSGTTTLAAMNLGRSSVGYEINPDFLPVIRKRLGIAERDEAARFASGEPDEVAEVGDATFEISATEQPPADFEKEIADLLYTFRDPAGLERKVDPRKRRFGSRIDGRRKPRETYYTVKEVVSPEVLMLDDDLSVRLMGIEAIPGKEKDAVTFLREKTCKARVYLRYDSVEIDSPGNRWAYVYLSNRTFINAHLIKNGLADVDKSVDFKQKSRFLKFREANLHSN
jgi:site-specific DNA-methyltransferase (adenine-specific)